MAGRQGKHWGALAGGFGEGLMNAIKLSIMMKHYEAMEKHWEYMEGKTRGSGPPASVFEGGAKGDVSWGGGTGGGGSYTGSANAAAHGAEMAQYLQDKYGLSPAGAAAVVGNAWQESGFAANFKPGGDKGTAAGMFQWREGRQTDARNWMHENGKDPSDWKSHLDYAMHETERDYPKLYDELKTSKDAGATTRSFFSTFERGAPDKANMPNRSGMAQAVMNRTGAPATGPKTEVAKTPADKKPDEAKAEPAKAEPAKAEPAKTDEAKSADKSAALDTPYQTAGLDWTGVSAEGAKHAAADLEAHRVQPAAFRARTEGEQEMDEADTQDPNAIWRPQPTSAIEAQPTFPPVDLPYSPSGAYGGGSPTQQSARSVPPYGAGYGGGSPTQEGTRSVPPAGAGYGGGSPTEEPSFPPPMRTGEVNAPLAGGQTDSRRAPAQPTADITTSLTPSAPLGPEWSNMPSPGMRDPKGVYAPKPAAPSKEADKPARHAQPVSATRPAIPPSPQGDNSRFSAMQYGTAERGPGSAPYITALNLNWGANPPVAERVSQGVTSQPVSSPGPTPLAEAAPSRLPDDMAEDAAAGMSMGACRGGPIQRFAGGGIPSKPTTAFAGAGIAGMMGPNYVGPTIGGGWAGTPYAQLAPNQQAWADTTGNLMNQIYAGGRQDAAYWGGGGQSMTGPVDTSQWINQLTPMPAAQWPAAPTAPAAAQPLPPAGPPTPVPKPTGVSTAVNPAGDASTGSPASVTGTDSSTTGTTTGAFNLPDLMSPSNPAFGSSQGGTDFTNTQSQGGTNYNVDTTGALSGKAGFARGGIPGRPTMKFAAGGGSYLPANMTYEPYWQQQGQSGPLQQIADANTGGNIGAVQMMAPYVQKFYQDNPNYMPAGYTYSSTPANMPGGGTMNSINATPYYNIYKPTPAAAASPAAPAPAAPAAPSAPVAAPTRVPPPTGVATAVNPAGDASTGAPKSVTGIDKSTTGTTTGAFNLPDLMSPSNPAFGSSQGGSNYTAAQTQNKGGANYNVNAAGDVTTDQQSYQMGGPTGAIPHMPMPQQVYGTTAARFRRGGAIQRYDDGGAISDPGAAPLGPPPGLAGAGQQVPPIYFNPATYAGAGAPVGKGVSQASAPTYVAGAIPSMPMARGGVVGYADGGGIDLPDTSYEDMQMTGEMERGGGGAQADDMSPQGLLGVTPAQYDFETPPAGANAITPQVRDNQGNPSPGLIGAISDGLHNLGGWLGLGGGQNRAIAGDPETQGARQNFASGSHPDGTPGLTDQDVSNLHNAVDPNGQLTLGMKQLMGMEAVRNWYMNKGDQAGAEKTAALMMQKSVELSQRYGDQAMAHFYKGDMQGVADALTQAKAMIADGTLMNAKVADDGQSIIIDGRNLAGKELWKQVVGPGQLLNVISKVQDGSGAWHLYETAAGKYASDYGARVKRAADDESDRRAQRNYDYQTQRQQEAWQHQQDVLDQKEAQKKADAEASAARIDTALHRGKGAIPSGPQVTPVSDQPTAPAAPAGPSPASVIRGDDTGENVGQGPTIDRAASDTGISTADYRLSSPGGVETARYQIEQNIAQRYPPPDLTGLSPLERRSAETEYNDNIKPIRDAMYKDLDTRIAQANQMRGFEFQATKARETQEFTASQTKERMEEQERLQAGREGAAAERTRQAELEKVRGAYYAPRDTKEMHSTFSGMVDPETNVKSDTAAVRLARGLTAGGVDTEGKPLAVKDLTDNYNTTFKPAEQQRLETVLHRGFYYTKEGDVDDMSDAVAGAATGRYHVSYEPIDMRHYGYDTNEKAGDAQMYTVTVERPTTRTTTSFRLPARDLDNLLTVQNDYVVRNAHPFVSPSTVGATPYAPRTSEPAIPIGP